MDSKSYFYPLFTFRTVGNGVSIAALVDTLEIHVVVIAGFRVTCNRVKNIRELSRIYHTDIPTNVIV